MSDTCEACGQRAPNALTDREKQIACLIAAGKTNKEISFDVDLSDKTIKNHIKKVFEKTGTSCRAELVAWAFRNGIVE